MKRKKFTKILSLAFFAMTMCLGGSFLQGCSQDDGTANNAATVSGYTAEQKAEILAFAKQYGVEVSLDSLGVNKLETVEEVESEIKDFADAFSTKQTFVLLQDGKIGTSNLSSLSSPIRLRDASESWSTSRYAGSGTISMTISWALPTTLTAGSANAVTTYTPNYSVNYIGYTQSGTSSTWYGLNNPDFQYSFMAYAQYMAGTYRILVYGIVNTGTPGNSTMYADDQN